MRHTLFSRTYAILAIVLMGLPASPLSASSTKNSLHWEILDAENHRQPMAPALLAGASSNNPKLRALTMQALGRIGDPQSLPTTLQGLSDRNAVVREKAAFAVGMIGSTMTTPDGTTIPTLVEAFKIETSSNVKSEIALALGRAGNTAELSWFSLQLEQAIAGPHVVPPLAAVGIAQGAGFILTKSAANAEVPELLIKSLIKVAASTSIAAAQAGFALSRYAGVYSEENTKLLIDAFSQAPVDEARAFLARALGRTKATSVVPGLIAAAAPDTLRQHIGTRVNALRSLGNFEPSDAILQLLEEIFSESIDFESTESIGSSEDNSEAVKIQALATVEKLGVKALQLAPQIISLIQPSSSIWLRDAALTALVAVDTAAAKPFVMNSMLLNWPLNRTAITTLPTISGGLSETDLDLALQFLGSADIREATAAAGSISSFSTELVEIKARAPMLSALSRPDAALTSIIAETAAQRGWRDFAAPLAETYKEFIHEDDVEVKVAIVTALGAIGDAAVMPVLEAALKDDARSVALAAAESIKAITDQDVSDQVPAASRISATTPELRELLRSANAKVRVETTRGTIVLQLLDSAPLTAANFVKLARSSFYNGKTFHRVIPYFVAQGGDPRGDGYGGPGYMIRDEVGGSHSRGTVGMATAGKDTGGCQFFINHGPNLHLDGSYTVFAKVVFGLDVIDRIQADDVMTSMKVMY